MSEPCGHPAEPGRKRCRECRRKPGRQRASRLVDRPGRGKRAGEIFRGITPEEWVAIYNAQGGVCAICAKNLVNRYDPGPQDPDAKIANLDHDHKLEKTAGLRASLRGLLCYHCNRNILGLALKDNALRALRAFLYLQEPPARRVLNAGN